MSADSAGGERARRLRRPRREKHEAAKIIADAKAIDVAGAFCIVLEGVMEEIANDVAGNVEPP